MIEQFLADGIVHMFGNPGTVEQGFLDAAEDFPEFGYVLALQEAVAAGIADGYARATGGPALLQLHSGVGLGNAVGMLYQAKRGHAPLLAVAGESGLAFDAMDAQMAVDLVAMARPVTKFATRVVHPGSLLRVLRKALKIALTPPRGPVFVALPMDVLDAPNDEPVLPTVLPDTRTVPAPDLVRRAADLLAGAQRPVLLVGDGVTAAAAQDEVVAVAELLGADVWSVDSSEPNVPADHPLSRGQLGHMFGAVSTAALRGTDAALVVGTYLFPEVFPELADPLRDAAVVHVDLDAYEIGKNHPVDLGLVADPRLTLAALAERLRGRAPGPRARPAAPRLVRRRTACGPSTDPTGPGLLVPFLRELSAVLPADTVVFDEGITASPFIGRYLPGRRPGSSYLTRGGSLGVGVPGALGIQVAHPDRTVLAFTGDGGAMYTIQALWTAARHGLPVKVVVCNNHRYRLLDDNLDQYWREREISGRGYPGSFGLSGPDLDFVGLARALGADGVTVGKPEDVGPGVLALLAADGPFLVDLATHDQQGGPR